MASERKIAEEVEPKRRVKMGKRGDKRGKKEKWEKSKMNTRNNNRCSL